MKKQLTSTYSSREWLRALGLSALCGIAAIGVWFVVLLSARGMPQALSGSVKQGIWLLPSVIVLLSPVLLIAGRQDPRSVDRTGGS